MVAPTISRTLSSAALGLGWLVVATAAAAQDPDTLRGPGPPPADSSLVQDTAAAGRAFEPLNLAGSVVLGGALMRLTTGAFHSQLVEASKLDDQGATTETATFVRRLAGGASLGPVVSLTGWLSETWGVRLEASASWPAVRPVYGEGGQDFLDAGGGSAEVDGRLSSLEATGAVLFRLPVEHPFYTPYALMGLGVRRYDPGHETLPAGADSAFAGGARTAVAGVVGIGAYVPVRENVFLQVEALRRVTPTPIGNHVTGMVFEGDSLRVVFLDPADAGDTTIDTIAGWRFSVGLSFLIPFGRQQEGPQAPGETSSNRDEERSVPRTRSRTRISIR